MGANLGDPEATLRRCLAALAGRLGPRFSEPLRIAPLYRSAPLTRAGEIAPRQPPYLNTVALGRLAIRDPVAAARTLLGLGKDLERLAGRDLGDRRIDAPRPLDVDLLLLGEHVLSLSPEPGQDGSTPTAEPWWRGPILVPHPRLRDRRFVLAPLADLEPSLAVPPDGRTAADLLATVANQPIERLAARPPFGTP